MNEPINIESLDPLYRDVFRDPANGTPDNISKTGCLVLAILGREAWNAWRLTFPATSDHEYGVKNNANFEGHNFVSIPKFSGFKFGDYANFSNAKFDFVTLFDYAEFGRQSLFINTIFSGPLIKFNNAKFGVLAKFNLARFSPHACFLNIYFNDGCSFNFTRFEAGVDFENTVFGERAEFVGAMFEQSANFKKCTFKYTSFEALDWDQTSYSHGFLDEVNVDEIKEWAIKKSVSPKTLQRIYFCEATFLNQCSFKGRTFLHSTDFSKSKFTYPPSFYDCKLNQDTTFDEASFPNPMGKDAFIRAYRTLKLAFSQQQAIREEQRFFKLEMAEEAARATGTQRFLYKSYSFCSDYGFSITRPAVLLAVTLAAMMLIYGVLSYLNNCLPDANTCRFSTAWIEFSLLQSLPLPGLDKLSDTLRRQLFPTEGLISIAVTVAVILHKAISLLALFLMGLALRNLFKLK